MIMINANDARELMGFDKAMSFINKNIKKAAMAGETSYTYTTNLKAKAKRLVYELKQLDYSVRFIHTPRAKREHKIVVNW